jgi:hypothetical protein
MQKVQIATIVKYLCGFGKVNDLWRHRLPSVSDVRLDGFAVTRAFIKTYPDLTRFPDRRFFGHLPRTLIDLNRQIIG